MNLGREINDEFLVATRRIRDGRVPMGVDRQAAPENLAVIRGLGVDRQLGDAVVAQCRCLTRDATSLTQLEKD